MTYAQIANDQICNVIVVDEETLLPLFSKNFDHLVRIDDLNPQPGMGWGYDGFTFSPPISE